MNYDRCTPANEKTVSCPKLESTVRHITQASLSSAAMFDRPHHDSKAKGTVKGHTKIVKEHTMIVKGHAMTVKGHTMIEKGHTMIVKGHAMTVKGHTMTVKGHTVTVKRHTMIVKGHTTTVKGHTMTVKGHTVTVKRHTMTVKGHTVTVKGHTMIVKGHTMIVKGHTMTVMGHTKKVKGHAITTRPFQTLRHDNPPKQKRQPIGTNTIVSSLVEKRRTKCLRGKIGKDVRGQCRHLARQIKPRMTKLLKKKKKTTLCKQKNVKTLQGEPRALGSQASRRSQACLPNRGLDATEKQDQFWTISSKEK